MPLDENSSEKWSRVQARLRATLGEDVYTAWFSRLQLEDILAPRVYFSVPTTFLKSWIEKHHLKELTSCTAREFPETQKVVILHRVAGKPVIIPQVAEKAETVAEEPQEKPLQQTRAEKPLPSDGKVDEERDHAEPEGLLLPLTYANGKIGINGIIYYTCSHFKLPRALMMSSARARQVVRARMSAMFLSKEMTERSLPDIGRMFGGRDHTTVLHSVRRIEKLITDDTDFAKELEALRATILNHRHA
jgi:chromosomal replication initiation ATPase DnaA